MTHTISPSQRITHSLCLQQEFFRHFRILVESMDLVSCATDSHPKFLRYLVISTPPLHSIFPLFFVYIFPFFYGEYAQRCSYRCRTQARRTPQHNIRCSYLHYFQLLHYLHVSSHVFPAHPSCGTLMRGSRRLSIRLGGKDGGYKLHVRQNL